jgi:hypothetical protein
MMTEIALNVLDVAENSVRANASLVEIEVKIDQKNDLLSVLIKDNGCGMSKEQLEHVEDPFFTTRKTRKVGLGIPFYKMAALAAGGEFYIKSEPGVGTETFASFGLSNIDRMPLGDINGTIHTLIVYNEPIDFVYHYVFNDAEFTLDTREFREILGGISFKEPEISQYIMDYLSEQKTECDGGVNV